MMNSPHGWMTDGGGVVEMEEDGRAENGGRDGNAQAYEVVLYKARSSIL
jgi:hypothetical protein